MPECSGAPNESKPARLSSRPITASWAKVPPAPPYRSGIAGQSSPAVPALVQTARSYMPSSFQLSSCGTYAAAMKRRACSSSRTRSSVIQLGGGRLRMFMTTLLAQVTVGLSIAPLSKQAARNSTTAQCEVEFECDQIATPDVQCKYHAAPLRDLTVCLLRAGKTARRGHRAASLSTAC